MIPLPQNKMSLTNPFFNHTIIFFTGQGNKFGSLEHNSKKSKSGSWLLKQNHKLSPGGLNTGSQTLDRKQSKKNKANRTGVSVA